MTAPCEAQALPDADAAQTKEGKTPVVKPVVGRIPMAFSVRLTTPNCGCSMNSQTMAIAINVCHDRQEVDRAIEAPKRAVGFDEQSRAEAQQNRPRHQDGGVDQCVLKRSLKRRILGELDVIAEADQGERPKPPN